MRLVGRILVYGVSIVALAVGLYSFLTNAKMRSVLADVESSRFEIIGAEVRATVERTLRIGLPLEASTNIQSVVDRTREDTPEIRSLIVFDDTGRQLYEAGRPVDTMASEQDRPRVPQDWVRALTQNNTPAVLRLRAAEGGRLLIPILGPRGTPAGGVALAFATADADAIVARTTAQQWRIGAVALIVASLIAGLATIFLVRPLANHFRRLEGGVKAISAGTTTPQFDDHAARDAVAAVAGPAGTIAADLDHLERVLATGPGAER